MRLYTRSEQPGAKLYAEFQVRNKRYQWSTRTSDPIKAAERANEYMQRVIDGQMGLVRKMTTTDTHPTIQQVLDYYEQHAVDVKPASRACCRCALLRMLKASKLQTCRSIDVLTDTTWQTYRQRMIAGKDGDALNSAKRTANSTMRQAKSIFARPMMRQYRNHFKIMPDMSAFLEMEYLRAPHPGFKAVSPDVLQRAVDACKAAGPAYHISVLLSLFAGLRYSEIRNARWDWITEREDGSALVQVPSEFAKSKKGRTVPISADVLADLKVYQRPNWPYVSPKCRYHFSGELTAVLKKAGITSRKACHEMRKQFGAMIATRSGLYAAQKLLGHSSPTLTSQIYADLTSMPEPLATTAALGLVSRKTPPAQPPGPQPQGKCEPETSCSPISGRPVQAPSECVSSALSSQAG